MPRRGPHFVALSSFESRRVRATEGHMDDAAEIAGLRTLLKNVNSDYSALLRRAGQEGKLMRLEVLKDRRLALMSHIAELRRRQIAAAMRASLHPREPLVAEISRPRTLLALVLRAKVTVATVQRYGAGWLGSRQAPSGASAVPSPE